MTAPVVETYRIGLPGRVTDPIHAVPESHVRAGNRAAHGPIAPACCGEWVLVAETDRFGLFDHTDPGNWSRTSGGACPACAWHVALERDAWDAEIDAVTPSGRDRDALTALGVAPDLVARLLRAAIAAHVSETGEQPGGWGRDRLVPLLAQITAHRPTPTYTGVEDDDEPLMPVDVVCMADSLTATCSCGDDHFVPACVVAGPCDVLRTIAEHLEVNIDG